VVRSHPPRLRPVAGQFPVRETDFPALQNRVGEGAEEPYPCRCSSYASGRFSSSLMKLMSRCTVLAVISSSLACCWQFGYRPAFTLLDRSGSMEAIANDAIGGFNAFVDSQRRQPGEARMTLILFDDRYEVPIKSQPLAQVPLLSRQNFVPRGRTALLHAIGQTIKKMTESFAARPVADRPDAIIVAILTDGEENASRRIPSWARRLDFSGSGTTFTRTRYTISPCLRRNSRRGRPRLPRF